jgi:hypothetical protein
MLGTGLIARLRRLCGLAPPPAKRREVFFYQEARVDGQGSPWRDRWRGTEPFVEFRSDDEVLDIGCAEGFIAVELAKTVRRVHGLEHFSHRAEAARRLAAEHGASNITVETAGIETATLGSLSYDVVLMSGVYGVPLDSGGAVGSKELEKALCAARRQVVLRVNVQEDPQAEGRLEEIAETCDRLGFDTAAFPKLDKYENLILAFRRGSDARMRQAPQLMLVPTRLMQVNRVVAGAPFAPWRFAPPGNG